MKCNKIVILVSIFIFSLLKINAQGIERDISVAGALNFGEYGVQIKSSYTGSGSVTIAMNGVNKATEYLCGIPIFQTVGRINTLPKEVLLYKTTVTGSKKGSLDSGVGVDGTVHNSNSFTACNQTHELSNGNRRIKTNYPIYYRRNIRTYNYVTNNWGMSPFHRLGGFKVPVTIKITYSGDISEDDVDYFKLPGMSKFSPKHTQTVDIRGINFTIRKAASNISLDLKGIEFKDQYSSNLFISKNLLPNDENYDYEIAVPRIKYPDVTKNLPRDFKTRTNDSHTTNLVLYPNNKEFYVISNTDPLKKITSSGSSTFTKKFEGAVFEAFIGTIQKTFYLYKITTTTNERVFLKKIGKAGPFPATKSNLRVKGIELNAINNKMLNKENLPDNEKSLIAWHRGFWRDFPENTLQSITAARTYLASSDMLELDVSRAKDVNFSEGVYNYVLYHDPFMFRSSSTGPNNTADQCVDPYDKLLVESQILALAQRANLRATLKSRFPGYTEDEYDDWIKAPSQYTLDELTNMTLRDRFGCLTDINIPTLTDAIIKAKENGFPIIVDKGHDDIDNIFWHAILNDYEDNVFFKGAADGRKVFTLKQMYGNNMFKQIAYTPYYFDNKAQTEEFNEFGVIWCEQFITAETADGWNIPGFELQIKMKKEDGASESLGFYPIGIQRLLDFNEKYRDKKWMGITQVNPTAYNGFDNKIIFMDATDVPKENNPYSSRFDRRADLDFNLNYIKCDYWTTDRPDVVEDYLKAIGKK